MHSSSGTSRSRGLWLSTAKPWGWDVIRAPLNIALAVPYIGAKLTAKLLTDRFREAHPETPKLE